MIYKSDRQIKEIINTRKELNKINKQKELLENKISYSTKRRILKPRIELIKISKEKQLLENKMKQLIVRRTITK